MVVIHILKKYYMNLSCQDSEDEDIEYSSSDDDVIALDSEEV